MVAQHQAYTYPSDLLRDRIILITGASDGIGRALALKCAELGAQLILHGRNVHKLEAVYDQIEALPAAPRPSIALLDLATAESSAYLSLAENLEKEFGRLDGLVHNAGILGDRFAIAQYDVEQWQRVLHVNVTAAFALTQVCLPMLQQANDPSIVFTSSGVGRRGKAYWGAYAVSKFATEGLSQVLADEHRQGKLRVNCVNPGATRTKMRLAAYPAEDRDALQGPADILPTYLFLLGPDSKGVTGESLDAQ
ncbi:MAG: YciK family oxidoreductase [Gammaproteobacteria bacterium]|nr:YciK family oxidoreductase [Gammaproteobacteria bacterium]